MKKHLRPFPIAAALATLCLLIAGCGPAASEQADAEEGQEQTERPKYTFEEYLAKYNAGMLHAHQRSGLFEGETHVISTEKETIVMVASEDPEKLHLFVLEQEGDQLEALDMAIGSAQVMQLRKTLLISPGDNPDNYIHFTVADAEGTSLIDQTYPPSVLYKGLALTHIDLDAGTVSTDQVRASESIYDLVEAPAKSPHGMGH